MPIAFLRRAARALAPAALLTLAAAPAFADGGVEIAKVAPARSFLVVSVPDFSAFRSAFDKSDFGALWREPSIQSFVEELTKDQTKQFGEFLQEVGIKSEDLKAPTGQVGLAMFMPEKPADADKPDPKDKKAEPAPEVLIIADMGPNADGLQDSLDRLIDRGVKDKKITTEEDTYAGAKITSIKPIAEKKAAKPESGKEDDDVADEDDDNLTGLQKFLAGPLTKDRDLQIARSGSEFMLCTSRKAVEAALDAAAGKGGDAIADASTYRDSLGQHPSASLATAVLFGAPLMDLFRDDIASGFASGEDVTQSDTDAAAAVLSASGLSSIQSVSLALRMDTPDAMAEMSFGILAPEKKGVLTLFTEPLGPFDPPAFVPPDAASVMRFSVKFSGIFDLLRSVAAALPEAQRKAFSSSLDQGANIVKPLLDAAGPSVYTFTTYKQPFAIDSEQATFAIQTHDQAAVSNMLVAFAPSIGLESREFEGNTLYSREGFPIAIGLGFDRVFYGAAPGVESAMRLASHADAPKISAEPGFKEATRSLTEDSVMTSFNDTRQAIRWAYWQIQNEDKVLEERINASNRSDDQKAEIIRSIHEHRPAWQDHLPPLDTILSHLGDSASEMHPTPDGFRGRSLLLKPSAQDAK